MHGGLFHRHGLVVGVDLDVNTVTSRALGLVPDDISYLKNTLHVSNVQVEWNLNVSQSRAWQAAENRAPPTSTTSPRSCGSTGSTSLTG